MTTNVEPKPIPFPVDFFELPVVAYLNDTTLNEMISLFGEPTGLPEPSDPGPIERWAFEFPCGLRLVYWFDVLLKQTLVSPDIPEVAHVGRHLPFDRPHVNLVTRAELQYQIDGELRIYPDRQSEFDSLDVAQVWRQGDDGNKFTVGEPTSERDAKCHVAELESHGHKQLYWYTIRQ